MIKDRYDWKKSCDQMAYDVELNRSTVWQILKRQSYKKVKLFLKFELTKNIKKIHLIFWFFL